MHATGRCKDSRLGNDWSSAIYETNCAFQTHLEYMKSTSSIIVVALNNMLIHIFSHQTYEERPRIRGGFRSTKYTVRCWCIHSFGWCGNRSNTTGNFLLLRFSGSYRNIFDIREAAGRPVERIRPERKVWLLLVIETGVRINCVHHRDRWSVSEIATCEGARPHQIVSCKVIGRKWTLFYYVFNSVEDDINNLSEFIASQRYIACWIAIN